jgi:DNA-directed RNA polymerase subunit omega
LYQAEDSMMHPQIEDLLSKVDSKFTLVSLGASRARQINQYYNNLGEGLGRMIPPQVTSVARKPLSIAFEEIAVDKIVVGEPVAEVEVEVEVVELVEVTGDADDTAGDTSDESS